MSERPVLLVLRPLGLGDHLTGIPAYRALAAAYPDHHRVLATSEAMVPLGRLTGSFDEVIGVAALAPLVGRVPRPDTAVDLHGRGPASQRRLVELEPRRLIAFAHPDVPATAGGPRWRPDEHEVRRWCRMLADSGIPADAADLRVPAPEIPVLPQFDGATIIHPGAASRARRWPAERFAAVAAAERSAGRTVVVTGSEQEAPLADRVARLAGLPASSVMAGCTDVVGLVAAVARAAMVLSGDTGIAHVATAVGTPSVTLFGPIPPSEWGPPPGSGPHHPIWAGRRGDPHADTVDEGLLHIGVAEVVEAVGRLRASLPAAGAEHP